MGFERNRGNNTNLPTAGIGYIIVPRYCSRGEYIQRCYRTHQVSIAGGLGFSAMHNVKIADSVLSDIEFPTMGEYGSAVVWVRESLYNKPVIVALIKGDGEIGLLQPKQKILGSNTATTDVRVFIDAINGVLQLSSMGSAVTPSTIVIKATSTAPTGDKIRIESKDKIDVSARTLNINLEHGLNFVINDGTQDVCNFAIDYSGVHITDKFNNSVELNREGLTVIDSFENTLKVNKDETRLKDQFDNEIILNKENTQILTSKFNVGEGKEQMVLGNTLVNLMGELIDAINTLTVVTPQGASGTPINSAQFSAIKAKLNTMLSKLSNTD